MTILHGFPPPSPEALQRSKALALQIRQEIDKYGLISFSTFMEMALYHPRLGYYNALSFSIGKKGDFITAPEISPLFAQCFAEQCKEIFEYLGKGDILELGAGTGLFAADILLSLQQKNALPNHYYIYEISPVLRQKQQDWINSTYPAISQYITWLDALPTNLTGIIIANEVLDALPVHCFQFEHLQVKERCVIWKNHQFDWQLHPPTIPLLTEKVLEINETYPLSSPYISEINMGLPHFMHAIANVLTRGVILLADYGYGQGEYYQPKRHQGSLAGFYQHKKYTNPLIYPGLLDMTAHVNFTAVIENAAAAHCQLAGYTTQAAFLLSCGLLKIAAEIENTLSPVDEFTLHQAIKVLTLPTEMGECIKIMALSKHMDLPLLGFQSQDRRRDL